VTRRVAPTTTRISLPSISVAAVEVPGDVAAGKVELDLSKALTIETEVTAAVDPSVSVSLVSGPDLSPAWADIVAAEAGLDASGAAGWLLYSLQEGRPQRSRAVAFLEALEAVGATAHSLAESRRFDDRLREVVADTPFVLNEAHGGGEEELAAARDYAVLMGWWGLGGLLRLAEYDAQLRASERSATFAGDDEDPQLQVDIELAEAGSAELEFTLIGLAPDVTRFAVRAATLVDGVEDDVEYSNIVSIARREGDLVWWEDEDYVTVIEGRQAFTV
jgi:hypothetical protein